MKDAENLQKLLSRTDPEGFREALSTLYDIDLPDYPPATGKRAIRGGFAQALSFLPFARRRELDEWAERINLLTDAPGKDAVAAMRAEWLEPEEREAIDALENQYDRSLWLYVNCRGLFQDALNARLADVFRQSTACYEGFLGPRNLAVRDDDDAVQLFHGAVSRELGCPPDQVAVDVFRRVHPDSETGEDVSLFQVSIHYNLPPEVVDCVEEQRLEPKPVTRAVSAFVTYEPSNGVIEVLSKAALARGRLARLAADCLLESAITGETIPIKQYTYQFLASPYTFDIGSEPVDRVKITRLGTGVRGEGLEIKARARDADTIHDVARRRAHSQFRFADHRLTLVHISVKIRAHAGERARTVNIVLSGDNRCNIKAKREKDRVLCERLLQRWGIVREVGHALPAAANDD